MGTVRGHQLWSRKWVLTVLCCPLFPSDKRTRYFTKMDNYKENWSTKMEVQQIHGKWWCWKWNLNPHLSTLTPTRDPWAILLNRSHIQPLLTTSTPPTLLQATVGSCLDYCNSLTGLPISSFASSFNICSVHQPEWSCHSINGFPSLLRSPAHLIQNKKARPSNDLQSPTIGPHPTRCLAVSPVFSPNLLLSSSHSLLFFEQGRLAAACLCNDHSLHLQCSHSSMAHCLTFSRSLLKCHPTEAFYDLPH